MAGGLSRYEVHRGRILTWSLEVHVVDHCNLRCAHCCTLSPHLPRRVVDPSAMERDLAAARRVLAPSLLKLTGGEPLLHPDILRCAEIARASGIARFVSLTTNGLLLASAPDELFRALDRLTVSIYPSARIGDAALSCAAERCREHGVRLTLKPMPSFQLIDAAADLGPVHGREVFAGCWLRHRCHLLRDGRVFPCTRPPHLAERWGDAALVEDGVQLDGEVGEIRDRVLALLERREPLASCNRCLGSSGPWEEHRQELPVR